MIARDDPTGGGKASPEIAGAAAEGAGCHGIFTTKNDGALADTRRGPFMCFYGKSAPRHSLPGWSLARGRKDLGTLEVGTGRAPVDSWDTPFSPGARQGSLGADWVPRAGWAVPNVSLVKGGDSQLFLLGLIPLRNRPAWTIFLLQLRKRGPFTLDPHGMRIRSIPRHVRVLGKPNSTEGTAPRP